MVCAALLSVFWDVRLQVYHKGIASVQSMDDGLIRAITKVSNATGEIDGTTG